MDKILLICINKFNNRDFTEFRTHDILSKYFFKLIFCLVNKNFTEYVMGSTFLINLDCCI